MLPKLFSVSKLLILLLQEHFFSAFFILLVDLKQESARCLSREDAVKTSKVQADEGVPETSLGSRSYGGGGNCLFHVCCVSSCKFSVVA